ncbi:MAG: hypothetical protein WCK58_04045 [Chloroflexota bacterium]
MAISVRSVIDPAPPRLLLRRGGVGSETEQGRRHGLSPAAMLAADADLLAGSVAAHPEAWCRPGFAIRVDAVRCQLEPLSTKASLVDSFGREALHLLPAGNRPGVVRVAYAIRLLELETGFRLPPWSLWVTPCAHLP